MTVKRFEVTFNDSDFHLKDNETCEELKLVDEKVCYDYIADRWNALHEENEYLHKYNTKLQKQPLLFDVQTIPNTMEIMEANTQLEKENEQLRTKNNAYIQDIEVFKEENTHLKLENGQLKIEAEELNEDAMSYQTLYEQQLEKFEELLPECKHQQEQKMKFYNENKELKQLIHTMLMQIDVENIGDENAKYSARIIFDKKDFKLLMEIWND